MMNGKIVLVTGATNGIGEVSALELSRMGAHVVLVGRSAARMEASLQKIRSAVKESSIEGMIADLSSLEGIRSVAENFKARHERLDVLLNNAGAVYYSRQLSTDGYEMTLALNHLSYFLLTHLLMHRLEKGAEKNGEARIVNVSSGAHFMPKRVDFDDIQREKRFTPSDSYCESKLMNVLFTYELARRLKGSAITANVLHPGFVRTGFGHNGSLVIRLGMLIAQRIGGLSPEEGAKTSIYLASSPEVRGVSGKYFEVCREKASSQPSYEESSWARLWQLSEALCGIKKD